MQIPSVMAKGKLLRQHRLFLGITGSRENAEYIARTVEMEVAVLQWHSQTCPLPQRRELLESNLPHLLSVEQMQRDPGLHCKGRSLREDPHRNVACATSQKYFYWINAVFKRLPSVLSMESFTSNSSFLLLTGTPGESLDLPSHYHLHGDASFLLVFSCCLTEKCEISA